MNVILNKIYIKKRLFQPLAGHYIKYAPSSEKENVICLQLFSSKSILFSHYFSHLGHRIISFL